MEDRLAIDGGEPAIDGGIPTIKDRSGRLIGAEEREQVMEVLDSGTLAYIYGSKVRRFEERFAELIGVEHAVAVSSGTAALHTALIYLNPEPGDEILVTDVEVLRPAAAKVQSGGESLFSAMALDAMLVQYGLHHGRVVENTGTP